MSFQFIPSHTFRDSQSRLSVYLEVQPTIRTAYVLSLPGTARSKHGKETGTQEAA